MRGTGALPARVVRDAHMAQSIASLIFDEVAIMELARQPVVAVSDEVRLVNIIIAHTNSDS